MKRINTIKDQKIFNHIIKNGKFKKNSYYVLYSNINNESDGAHNGENYIAYTFYLENQGTEIINYWYQVNILDVIKNVDEVYK